MNKINFSPKSHIFLWDLHGVILEKSIWSWFMACMRFRRKEELVSRLDKKSLNIAFTFLLERLKLTKKQMVSEELLKAAYESHNDALIELIMKVCSSYSPIKKTVVLMQELSNLGYAHHLGSNIGKSVFDDCAQKFSAIFDLFQECTIPFESEELRMIKKPHPDFFHMHIQKHKLQPQQLIFIDDKIVNIQAAQLIGMHAIHFKNAKQLRRQLNQWDIIT